MVMYSYYHYSVLGRWWWWSRGWQRVQGDPPGGGRYPICITTANSYDYILGFKEARNPPEDSDAQNNLVNPVIQLKDMNDWQSNWDRVAPFKLLVLEFYEKNSTPCEVMRKPVEKLARQYRDMVQFYTLDVDNFEYLARLCGVEGAYPTFLLFKNGRQVDKIVGVKEDDLKKSIEQALMNK
ncbi:hypothetical protein ACP4OV_007945 [Aristida adscensionis]